MSDEDIIIDHDEAAGNFLITPNSDKGYDWLDEYATASSEFWGKSLVVSGREIDAVTDSITHAGLEIYRRGSR